jgi:carboxyl-terminal processing protease
MSGVKKTIFLLLYLLTSFLSVAEGKLPALTPAILSTKLNDIMKTHASHKELTPLLIERTLNNYLEILDPNKSYFIEPDIAQWLHPSSHLLDQILQDYHRNNFSQFEQIHQIMIQAIKRRQTLEEKIDISNLPKQVRTDEFKEMKWTLTEKELLARLERIKALQIEASEKLTPDQKGKTLKRIQKRQAKYEEDILVTNSLKHEQFLLANILKATASALDSHTAYFTPDEAAQFMIHVQQRLFGIGAQLRDDLNGFSIIKIIEGGPAAENKMLKIKDRIIAVNGESVVGLDITDAVELIRGEENSPVTLTVIREVPENENKINEEKLDVTLNRGEVVLKDTRYESSYEPFGDGAIAYLKLYSFYQDPESSSASDLAEALKKIRREQHVKGVILDLRFNSGGLLSQAVEVTGLFITKGIVVSIKDDTGKIQHLRALEGRSVWEGPLVVLTNRASASASEIVAGTLQDYGRAMIVGDDHTFGKGSFQTFTLNTTIQNHAVNPQGEYKVTRGRYYTVSGRTPQLTGVTSDIVIPGPLAEMELGEQYAKYPLENDQIKSNFHDDLADIPFFQREQLRLFYSYDLQPRLNTYQPYVEQLRKNATYRIEKNPNYQNFLKELKKKEIADEEEPAEFGQNDLQLTEAYNVMKDVIILMQ